MRACMKRNFNGLLIIGITGTVFFGSFFAGEYLEATRGNEGIWWTPMNMALTLDQSGSEFELYIQKEMLQKRIEKGTLLMVDDRGKSSKVTANDVKVRLNNRHKVEAEKLSYSIITAFFSGISIALLVMGLLRFFTDIEGDPSTA